MGLITIEDKNYTTPLTPDEFNYLIEQINNRKIGDIIDVDQGVALNGQVMKYNGTEWVYYNLNNDYYTRDEINNLSAGELTVTVIRNDDIGESFYYDSEGILRLNISTHTERTKNWTTSGDFQKFLLDFEPTFFHGIYVSGLKLHDDEWIFTSPNELEILTTLEIGDKIEITYDRYIMQP